MKRTLVTTAALFCATIAVAHSGATGIVKDRMDGMGALSEAMKTLGTMARDGTPDPALIAEAARVIQANAGPALTDRFPEGSLPEVSEATPAIWEDWDRFAAMSDEMLEKALALETDATDPDLDLNAALKDMATTCTACHKDFRVKK